MAVKRNYRINLRNYGNPPAIMVSQYDENYDLVFEVFDGVVPATGLNTYTVKLVGRQPGNDPALKYEFTGTVSGIANNILSFTIDTTMTGRAGKGTAEIVILDTTNDVKFASFNLPVYVEKAAVPDDAIDADVERAQEIADEVQDIVDTAAADVKGEAEAWAVGERDGEPVPSTDPTYHNNAKYYAEHAQDIADSIGIDATLSISGKAADAKATGDEIDSLKEDLNEITEETEIEYTNAVAVPSDSTYWKINDNVPQLETGKTYLIKILPNDTFTLTDIKIGTNSTSASMVDTIASSVSFVANTEQSFRYSPSQNGLKYIRLYLSASKISSIAVDVLETEVVGPFVKYNQNMVLTSNQKQIARGNIGAASATDVNNIFNAVIIPFVSAVRVDSNFWGVTADYALKKDQTYFITFLPNESFALTDIKAGTSATGAGMVDTIATNISFVGNEPLIIKYTPSANGIRYFRIYQNATKLDSISIGIGVKTATNELQTYCQRNNILTKYTDRIDILTQLTQSGMKTFLVYTDIHGSTENLNRIAEWHGNNINSNVSDVICLGDMVVDEFDDGIAFMNNAFGNATLKVIGNHDVLKNSQIPGVTSKQAYDQYIAPNVASWNVTQPSDASTEGKNYYYKDYDNVRLIVLDTYFYTTAQDTWFASVLADSLTNNKTVIITEHEDMCTASEKQPLRNDYPFATKKGGFDGLQFRTVGDGGNYETKRNHVDDFISAGGKFACWLIGHQHKDMCGYYNGTHGKQTSLLFTNSSIVGSLGNKRIRGYSQDSFTYLGIDTTNGYIFVCRIGQTVDEWGHKNEHMVYDYVNGEIIEYNN